MEIPHDRNEFERTASVYRYLKTARAATTRKNWKYTLFDFFEFAKIHPDKFITLQPSEIEDLIDSYVDYLKERVRSRELSPNSIQNLVLPLKKFLIHNRVQGMGDAWIRIIENFPERVRPSDEKYTEIELQKMYQIADYREKALMGLLLAGMRIGSIKDLMLKDLKKVEDWAVARVYAGTNSEYHTFVTPQGLQDILSYIEYRKRNGETISQDTPLIRNDFRPNCAGEWFDKRGNKHQVPEPIHTTAGVFYIVVGLTRRAGISTNTHNFKTRHKTMTCHGFRKYFNTICKTSGMDSEMVELLLGHSTSLAGHYWRLPNDEQEMSPQELKLFQTIKTEYRRCIPELTVGESEALKIKNQELEGTLQEQMKEKEFQIVSLQRQISKMRENPFVGMSQEEMDGLVQMYQAWKRLKEEIPNISEVTGGREAFHSVP